MEIVDTVPAQAGGLTSFQSASEKFSAGVLHHRFIKMPALNPIESDKPPLNTPAVDEDIND